MKKVILVLISLFLMASFSSSVLAEIMPWNSQLTSEINEITVTQLVDKLQQGKKIYLIDVREPAEYEAGHLENAKNVPRGLVEFVVPRQIKDANAEIVVYCKSGARGALATQSLQSIGYKNVVNLKGAFLAWVKEGNLYYNSHGPARYVLLEDKKN